ncbi:MAG TPA: hypothetical protein VHD33_00360, partial [Legionellaceae bacterium]|nr:hypothetical protein [Legionellaceae bacterium]
VKEDTLFLHNTVDKEEDVANFRVFFGKKHSKKLAQWLDKIPHNVLDELLDTTRMIEQLDDKIDYLPIFLRKHQKLVQYGAPILNVGTKRPEPNVSYAKGGQPILHTMRNESIARGSPPFDVDLMTETLIVISAKNFFDFYFLNDGLIFGWTGTAGSTVELQEFSEENHLPAYAFSNFHPDLSEHLGVLILENRECHYSAILNAIRQERRKKSEQPIVIFTDSPKATHELKKYLQHHARDLHIQSYDGYEEIGVTEKEIIHRANQNNMVTISNSSLTRGTDFAPHHPQGAFAINTATDLTPSEVRQTEGRVARNGKPGQFCHILCSDALSTQTADILDPAARFQAHQKIISLNRQRDRLKTRLLENVRYHIVTDYLLKLRAEADTILTNQYGALSTLVPEMDFLKTLRDFNTDVETRYFRFLGDKASLNAEEVNLFIQEVVTQYQIILNRLIVSKPVQLPPMIEPLVALHELPAASSLQNAVKLAELNQVSQILSLGWRSVGHQPMVYAWKFIDDVIEEFQPYFNQRCGFKQ